MKKIIVAWLAGMALILPLLTARAQEPGDAILGVWHTTGSRGDIRNLQKGQSGIFRTGIVHR